MRSLKRLERTPYQCEVFMTVQERFEAHWKDRFGFEMKRGEGRAGYGLKQVDGVYVSDRVRFAFEIWLAATLSQAERMVKL